MPEPIIAAQWRDKRRIEDEWVVLSKMHPPRTSRVTDDAAQSLQTFSS